MIYLCCLLRKREEVELKEEVLEEVNEEGITEFYVMDDDRSISI